MAIRLAGALPITEIATEFGGEAPPIPLSDYYADGVFLSKGYAPITPPVPSKGKSLNVGAFYGKSKKVPLTITLTANEANVNVFAKFKASGLMTNYSNVDIAAILVINSGVTIHGLINGATPALTVPASDSTRTNGFKPTDDIIIQNNGNIIGGPGSGGAGGVGDVAGSAGLLGRDAILLSAKTTIINNGTIAGGANGGAGGRGGRTATTTETFCQQYTTSQVPQTTYTCGGQVNKYGVQQYCDGGNNCRPCGGNWKMVNKFQGYCECATQQAQTTYRTVTTAMGYASCSPRTYSTSYTNTQGGTGGNGATVFSNTAIAGTAGGGGNSPAAQAGSPGGLWGSGKWVVGYANLLNSSSIGGTKLGPYS